MLEPSRAQEALGADVIVGIPADRDRAASAEAAAAVQAGLRAAFPGRASIALVLARDTDGTIAPGSPLVPPEPGQPAPAVHAAGGGADAALRALVDVALAAGSPACALLEPLPRPADPEWLRALFDPILRGSTDLVAPAYSRGRFEGVLVTGVVYPLTRALFGQRIRQPLGREIVLSRGLAELLSRDAAWRAAPAGPAPDPWLVASALPRECRCAQAFLGARPAPLPQPPDVSEALAGVLGTVFHGMELHAARWQRIRGSHPAETYGEEILPGDPLPSPPAAPLVSAFDLGWRDLRRLWGAVLPPNTLYALQRITRDPPEAFRMQDSLWARIVYDFAVAWRVKVMDRVQLLRSMTPLYLGWVASFVNAVGPADRAGCEEHVERSCKAFEAEKPYLISRWRWPDRFMP